MTAQHTRSTPETPLSPTQSNLCEMLSEGTGRHPGDSGDFFGRHFEVNRHLDFPVQPPTSLSFSGGWISVTHHVFHWLDERLEFNPHLDQDFHAWAKAPEREELPWLYLMELWCNRLAQSGEGTGLYGFEIPHIENTYNNESLLSQILQYAIWRDHNDALQVLLSVHNGCDVRGGYTCPQGFSVRDCFGHALRDTSFAMICCGNCEAHWLTQDGCCWLSQSESALDLDTYDIVHLGDQLDARTYALGPSVGFLFVDEHDTGFCPVCAEGILAAV